MPVIHHTVMLFVAVFSYSCAGPRTWDAQGGLLAGSIMFLQAFLNPNGRAGGTALGQDHAQGVGRLLVLLLVIALMYAFSMGNHPFIPSMEPRFGEVIREMLARGEFLIPIKNGVPYIEYPPLYYWLALAGRLSGLPDMVAIRVPGALAFLLWIVWLARLQRVVRPTWPVYLLPLLGAALPGVLYQYFIAQSDTVLILGVLMAMTGYLRLCQGAVRGFAWELWLGVTLATLAKGPVGMAVTLPVLALDGLFGAWRAGQGPALWWQAQWAAVRRIAWLRGLALVMVFNVPWYLVVGLREGWELVRAMVVYQNFTRFLVGFDHIQPWWYYTKTIWYDMLPLAFLLPFALPLAWRRWGELQWRVPVLWLLWTMLFFSVSASKQGKYILTAAPAVALLGLLALEALAASRRPRWAHRVRAVLLGWAAVLVGGFAFTAVFILPHYAPRIGGLEGLEKIRAEIAARPAPVVSFQWPRSMELYVFGAPMDYVRSSRVLYQRLHQGKLKAGDYLLVFRRFLPPAGIPADKASPMSFSPPPAAPYFRHLLSVAFNGQLNLYEVLPGAVDMPMPATPTPLPHHWWERFDTD